MLINFLHYFVHHSENEAEAAQLIENGENANILDSKGKTPMHLASEKGEIIFRIAYQVSYWLQHVEVFQCWGDLRKLFFFSFRLCDSLWNSTIALAWWDMAFFICIVLHLSLRSKQWWSQSETIVVFSTENRI